MIAQYTPNRNHPWLTVQIETVGNSKVVTILSSIHVNKETKLPNSWDSSFSDAAILKDSDFFKHFHRFL